VSAAPVELAEQSERGARLVYIGAAALVLLAGLAYGALHFARSYDAAEEVEPSRQRGVAEETAAAGPVEAAPAVDEEVRRRDRERAEERQQQELAWARSQVSVTVYTTSWCPQCRRAKQWMDEAGVRYTEKDVEASAAAREERDRLTDRRAVPTFDVDGEVLVGFSPQALMQHIDGAARNRL
jgi:glutaredoxin